VPPEIGKSPAVKDQYRFSLRQHREPMGDDYDGAAGRDPSQVDPYNRLALGVERARSLVEDQDPRIRKQCPGNC
jgi:hypothetical protein